MQYSTCWIGQEYRFAGDIKRQRGQQALGKSHRRRVSLVFYERIAQNKAQTSSPKGGREGLILQE